MTVLNTIASIFWNGQEHRLRAGWRIVLQLVIWLVLSIVGAIAIDAAADSWRGSHPPGDLGSNLLTSVELLAANVLTVISVWLAGRVLDRRPFVDFGLHFSKDWWVDFAFGLALGAASITAIFLVEWLAGWLIVTTTLRTGFGMSFPAAILLSLLAFVAVGVGEELFSRGYQLKNLAEGLNLPGIGPRAAVVLAFVLTSVFFGWLHAMNPNATTTSTVLLMVAGLELGLAYVLTGELALPIGLHIAWNFVQGNVFGLPVSGMVEDATFIVTYQGGPDLWTGGAFGPEAGLIGLLASLGNMAAVVLWVRHRRGRIGPHQPLAQYEGRTG